MSPRKDVKFPPLTSSKTQKVTCDDDEGEKQVQTCSDRNLFSDAGRFIYAGSTRKPQLLINLESYVIKELQSIDPDEPKLQELKLQVYRDVFGRLIKEFKTYQPLLSAIKKEYDDTIDHQRSQIKQLEPLRSHLRSLTQECDQKIQARWSEEQLEVKQLKMDKRRLKMDVDAAKEKEATLRTLVEHLQHQLSDQYLKYREERDARKLLIYQINDLTRETTQEDDDNTDDENDPVVLRLALDECRRDLSKAQEELGRTKAEYWDVVPQRNFDALEQTHKQTLLQLKTLQSDFDQLKIENKVLLELQKRNSNTAETETTVSEEEPPPPEEDVSHPTSE